MQHILDEVDLRLAHAVQQAPRAAWTTIAPACGLHPITAARRWQRLVEAGLVSVLVTPGPVLLAQLSTGIVALECAEADRSAVIAALRTNPRVASIVIMAARPSVHVTVMADSVPALTALVLDEVLAVPGVLHGEFWPVTRMYAQGSSWRLDALSKPELQGLVSPRRRILSSTVMTDEHRRLFRALGPDARAATNDLAAIVGASPSTVSRRLAAMINGGLIQLRCDVSPEAAGWPVQVLYRLRVGVEDLDRAGRTLAAMPANRSAAAMAASTNLHVTQWQRDLSEVRAMETHIQTALPSVSVVDRVLTMRTAKRMGRIIDADGRSAGTVPLDPWNDREP